REFYHLFASREAALVSANYAAAADGQEVGSEKSGSGSEKSGESSGSSSSGSSGDSAYSHSDSKATSSDDSAETVLRVRLHLLERDRVQAQVRAEAAAVALLKALDCQKALEGALESQEAQARAVVVAAEAQEQGVGSEKGWQGGRERFASQDSFGASDKSSESAQHLHQQQHLRYVQHQQAQLLKQLQGNLGTQGQEEQGGGQGQKYHHQMSLHHPHKRRQSVHEGGLHYDSDDYSLPSSISSDASEDL
ncbi:hypothetical protein B484DRAFT_403977, partial [Ochromonadaceae sp. CCMP2298]